MRSDMFKVIVERPRGNGKHYTRLAWRRRFDWEDSTRAGMRDGIRVGLNENLRPLERYLHAQVGRPWSKVHGEIAATIDRRNTVQQHVYQHIDDFIATQVEWRDGGWVDLKTRYWNRGDDLYQPLYVDPRTGLIRRNERYRSWSARRRDRVAREAVETSKRRKDLSKFVTLLRIDGQWYEIRLAVLPPSRDEEVVIRGKRCRRSVAEPVFDVVRRARVSSHDYVGQGEQKKLYGGERLYAAAKRQLSRREIRQHDLPQDDATVV